MYAVQIDERGEGGKNNAKEMSGVWFSVSFPPEKEANEPQPLPLLSLGDVGMDLGPVGGGGGGRRGSESKRCCKEGTWEGEQLKGEERCAIIHLLSPGKGGSKMTLPLPLIVSPTWLDQFIV